MDFNTAVDRVLGHEGGYVNHPADPGGETNWGVTKAVAREHGYTGSMREMTRNEAKKIYRKAYWQAARCDELPAALAFQVFDAAVNHGVKRAVILLQRAAGADDDGKFGKDTLAAVKCASPNRLVARFNGYRLQFYTQIKTFPTFGKGWSRRVAGNLRHAVNDGCSAELRTIARGIEAYFDAHSAKAAGAKANMAAFAQKLKETA